LKPGYALKNTASHAPASKPAHPSRRIVLIGNRDDKNTPFVLQQRFGDAVAKAGHRIELKTHAAEPPTYHDLTDRIGLQTASLCAREALFPPLPGAE
jgi:hypothetical protein